jgi:Uma2 family endonuclease
MVAVPESVTRRHLTFEDYQALPDDQRYEIVKGVLYVAPRPRPLHQLVAFRLTRALDDFVQAHRLGQVIQDTDLVLTPHDIYVAPDIMYFAGSRFDEVDPTGWVRIVPDLVVEVSSPSTEDYDAMKKREIYAEAGVPHYWRADPRRRELIEGVLQPGGAYVDRTWRAGEPGEPCQPVALPGLQLDLAAIFG